MKRGRGGTNLTCLCKDTFKYVGNLTISAVLNTEEAGDIYPNTNVESFLVWENIKIKKGMQRRKLVDWENIFHVVNQ